MNREPPPNMEWVEFETYRDIPSAGLIWAPTIVGVGILVMLVLVVMMR